MFCRTLLHFLQKKETAPGLSVPLSFLSRAGTRACSRELRDSRSRQLSVAEQYLFSAPSSTCKHVNRFCLFKVLLCTCSSGAASHPDTKIPSSCAQQTCIAAPPPHPAIGKDCVSMRAPLNFMHTTYATSYACDHNFQSRKRTYLLSAYLQSITHACTQA